MPLIRSWVESANAPDHPFPLNNLPYGVFSVDDGDLRCGIAIGDRILDATWDPGAAQGGSGAVFGYNVYITPQGSGFGNNPVVPQNAGLSDTTTFGTR